MTVQIKEDIINRINALSREQVYRVKMELSKSGYNQKRIQEMNRTLLLNILLKNGVCSRAQLAKLAQLKPATITNIVSDFIRFGIVREVGLLTDSKGRRYIGISINNDEYGVLAIRLSRRNFAVGIFNLSGDAVAVEREEIQDGMEPEIVFEKMIEKGKRLVESSKRKIIAIGMAIPGPYSTKKGRIEIMTGFAGWNKIPVQEQLEEIFQIPVFIEQDANAGALAHYWHDDILKDKMLIYIAVGQGVGAGIIDNGQLIKGAIGTTGEIGHMSINYRGPRCSCGNCGCLELYCSSLAFMRKVNANLKTEKNLTIEEAAKLLREGNEEIRKLYLEACDMLAVGIGNIIYNFNPAIIILGDEMAHVAPEMMLARVSEYIRERILPGIYEETQIRISAGKIDSMIHGAALVAIQDVFQNSEQYFTNI